jgi:hypothetical protein
MKLALCSLGLSALLLALSSLSAGCEVKDCKTDDGKDATCLESLTRYADPQYNQQLEVDYSAGKNITIDGIYGDITIQEGAAGKVTVTFAPFNYESHKDEAQAYSEIRNNLDLAAVLDDNEDVQIATSRHDAGNGLGAKITVLIPPEFSGTLKVTNRSDGPINPGNILIHSVGRATALDVHTAKLGDCRIMASPTVKDSSVICSGEILLEHVSDNVTAQSSSDFDRDDVIVTIDSISDDATGGVVTADAGNVQVTFPRSGNFVIDADTAGMGTIAYDGTPETCTLTEPQPGSADVVCGDGGATYQLAAGSDAGYQGFIVLAYVAQ